MENLYYNLSEEEFSKSRKGLLWGFSGLFFLGGIYILMMNLVFHKASIHPVISIAPFGISLVVGIIAALATIKRKNLFFSIDDNKIEFRYGFFKPVAQGFNWSDIKEIVMPLKQRKVLLVMLDGSNYMINLTWLEKKRSSMIKKHLYHAARAKNLDVRKVTTVG